MENNDLVSVVIPIYNVEKYLEKCVNSLVNQTYRNLEIILVDDGSTDNSGNIADELSKIDSRINVYHKKNGGLSDARNFGIEHANGKYICFVDSDDYVSLNYIFDLYNGIKEYNYDIAIVDFLKFDEKIKIYDDIRNTNIKYFSLTKEEAINSLFNDSSFGNYAWNKMYKLSLFKNIRYPIGKKMEDLGTTYKLFLKSDNIVYCDAKDYYYLQRKGSILHSKDTTLFYDKIEQSINRFYDIKFAFPNNEYNYLFIAEVILDCFAFIPKNSKLYLESIEIIEKVIPKKIVNKLTINKKIKLIIFKTSKKVYQYLFKRR